MRIRWICAAVHVDCGTDQAVVGVGLNDLTTCVRRPAGPPLRGCTVKQRLGKGPTRPPSPAPAQARATSARTRVMPDPAGALITDTRAPVSQHRHRRGRLVHAQPPSGARILRISCLAARAARRRAGSTPSACAACAGVRRGGDAARVRMRSS